jgi:hypothetical protein
MDIYLDTILWNHLLDQGVEPSEFTNRLAAKNAYLAPGTHDFYELARTFNSAKPNARERAMKLLSFFKRFVELDTHSVRENTEILAQEMWAVKLRQPVPDTLLFREDRMRVIEKAEKLANGEISESDTKFLDEQRQFALSARSNQIEHFIRRPDMKQELKSIPEAKVAEWLDTESTGDRGVTLLTFQVTRRFPEATLEDAVAYACAMLERSMRLARGLVRFDLYRNWRCAHRGSISKSLVDDSSHVLNAVYCDVYATEDAEQAGYAPLLQTANTRVAVYPRTMPVDRWIESLA